MKKISTLILAASAALGSMAQAPPTTPCGEVSVATMSVTCLETDPR